MRCHSHQICTWLDWNLVEREHHGDNLIDAFGPCRCCSTPGLELDEWEASRQGGLRLVAAPIGET